MRNTNFKIIKLITILIAFLFFFNYVESIAEQTQNLDQKMDFKTEIIKDENDDQGLNSAFKKINDKIAEKKKERIINFDWWISPVTD